MLLFITVTKHSSLYGEIPDLLHSKMWKKHNNNLNKENKNTSVKKKEKHNQFTGSV